MLRITASDQNLSPEQALRAVLVATFGTVMSRGNRTAHERRVCDLKADFPPGPEWTVTNRRVRAHQTLLAEPAGAAPPDFGREEAEQLVLAAPGRLAEQ